MNATDIPINDALLPAPVLQNADSLNAASQKCALAFSEYTSWLCDAGHWLSTMIDKWGYSGSETLAALAVLALIIALLWWWMT